MKILFLSHTAIGGPFVVGSHHLSRELSALGNEVHHISTPISPMHLIRRRPGGNVEIARLVGRASLLSGVRSYIPNVWSPLGLSRFVDEKLAHYLAAEILTFISDGAANLDVVLVDQPLFAPSLRHIPARLKTYRPTDIQHTPTLQYAEKGLVSQIGAVITTRSQVYAALPPGYDVLPHLALANGVDFDRFRFPFALDRAPVGDFIFIGALDERVDWLTIQSLAAAFPNRTLDLYGPVLTTPPSRLSANVHIHGPVEYEQVPSLLWNAKVGLLPFAQSQRNMGRSPMKLYEYLAANLCVLAPQWASDLTIEPGCLGYTSTNLTAVARVALESGGNEQGIKAAAQHGWSRKAVILQDFLKSNLVVD